MAQVCCSRKRKRRERSGPEAPRPAPRSAGEGCPRRGTWRPEPEEVPASLAVTTNSSARLVSPAKRTSISPDGPQPEPSGKRAFL